jgi:hypothetical protein
MRAFLRDHKKLAFVTLLIVVPAAWWLAAPVRGQMAARFDVWRGHYRVLAYGLPVAWRSEYAGLLQERYGIELHPVAGCVVSEALISYVRNYNKVSAAAANRKFGHDVLKECEEAASKSWEYQRSHGKSEWQKTDQLCGELEFATPKEKRIIVNGRKETRLYENPVKEADVLLYRGTVLDKTCCPDATPAARTQSDRFGRFEFSGFQSGWYWLRVEKDPLDVTIPVQITGDFDAELCRAPWVGRIYTVDAEPPKVQTRIY